MSEYSSQQNDPSTDAGDDAPLISQLAGDPEMEELVEFFIGDLRERMARLEAAMSDGDREALHALIHQLKGAAGGYGFPDITDAARSVEQTMLATEGELSGVSEQVEDLIALCRRAAASTTE